jgi:hypothetical protein
MGFWQKKTTSIFFLHHQLKHPTHKFILFNYQFYDSDYGGRNGRDLSNMAPLVSQNLREP